MPDLTLPLLAFLFPLAYSPGPGNMIFAATGARFGLAATLPASLGYHLATWIVTAALGFGFATALAQAPLMYSLLKWAGAGYVLWLAFGIWRAGAVAQGAQARPMGARDGAVLLLLNPKAYVIIVLMFSQFLGPMSQAAGVLWITTVFTLKRAGLRGLEPDRRSAGDPLPRPASGPAAQSRAGRAPRRGGALDGAELRQSALSLPSLRPKYGRRRLPPAAGARHWTGRPAAAPSHFFNLARSQSCDCRSRAVSSSSNRSGLPVTTTPNSRAACFGVYCPISTSWRTASTARWNGSP